MFAGDVIEAHRRGCAFVRDSAMVPVEEPFDAVVTTNSGYPLDQNLYQTVKGMQVAKGIVRPGGAIVLAAACEDGLPRHGRYAELLAEAGSPDAILELLQRPGFSAQDQWQVQIQAQIQRHADVYVYSDGPRRRRDPRCAAHADAGHRGRPWRSCSRGACAWLPEGPLTIAYLNDSVNGAAR